MSIPEAEALLEQTRSEVDRSLDWRALDQAWEAAEIQAAQALDACQRQLDGPTGRCNPAEGQQLRKFAVGLHTPPGFVLQTRGASGERSWLLLSHHGRLLALRDQSSLTGTLVLETLGGGGYYARRHSADETLDVSACRLAGKTWDGALMTQPQDGGPILSAGFFESAPQSGVGRWETDPLTGHPIRGSQLFWSQSEVLASVQASSGSVEGFWFQEGECTRRRCDGILLQFDGETTTTETRPAPQSAAYGRVDRGCMSVYRAFYTSVASAIVPSAEVLWTPDELSPE